MPTITKTHEETIKRHLKSHLLTCMPLNSYNEIIKFLENPPRWRTLCIELTPHSKYVVRNMDNLKYSSTALQGETPAKNFCHFEPDTDSDAAPRYDITLKKVPKTLVCHDMANGYHDDSKIDGSSRYDSYTFYNWSGIDIFCYFSHHLITIPPLAWINVGHAHGVKVIGTIISEWTDGVMFWDKVLESELEYRNFASAVVAIAKTLKFDGWLLNIENKIAKPDMLLDFVRHLHKTLHRELEDPVLIWYDSVTIHGKLSWQNGLNEKNKSFFHACDGFFTNYSWTEADLVSSVKEAGDRVTDLYIGIDVWGRNFYGGGQFNTHEAVKVANSKGCSLAIFAPAWTHEAITADPNDSNFVQCAANLNTYAHFQLRDRAFWDTIWPFFYTRLPCQLPFQTSFCRGQGRKRRMYGEVISPGPWYNLRYQQYQPNTAHGLHGYLLTTNEKLLTTLSTQAHKDKKGIIKQHDSPENEVVPGVRTGDLTQTDGVSTQSDKSESSRSKAKSRESLESEPEIPTRAGTSVDPEYTQPSKPILKKKLTDRVKYFLRKLPFFKSERDTPQGSTVPLRSIIVASSSGGGSPPVKEHSMPQPSSSIKESSIIEESPTIKESLTIENSLAIKDSFVIKDSNIIREISTPQQDSPPGGSAPSVKDDLAEELRIEANQKQEEVSSNTSDAMIKTSVNLNLRGPQLKTRWTLACVPRERECLQLYLEDSFIGGACIRVNPSDSMNRDHRLTRLFYCDFQCENALIFCVVTKPMVQYADQTLNVKLKMVNTYGQDLEVILLGRPSGMHSSLSSTATGIKYVYPVYSEEQAEFIELRAYLLKELPEFYVPIDNYYGWEIRYYTVEVPGASVKEIYLRTGMPQGGILFGHFGICSRNNVVITAPVAPSPEQQPSWSYIRLVTRTFYSTTLNVRICKCYVNVIHILLIFYVQFLTIKYIFYNHCFLTSYHNAYHPRR